MKTKKCRKIKIIEEIWTIWVRTWRCAYTTDPSSFQVPPRRSMRTMRKIWKKRRPRSADVANTWPLVPSDMTTIEAKMVTTSAASTSASTAASTSTSKSNRKNQEKIQYNINKNMSAVQAATTCWPMNEPRCQYILFGRRRRNQNRTVNKLAQSIAGALPPLPSLLWACL